MRPPLRLIDPPTRGVSMATRGDALSAASRVRVWPGTTPGVGAAWPGAGCVVVGAGCPVGAGAPGCGAGVVWVCCCCFCCCCCCIDGRPKKICHPISTMADSTMASSMFFWSFISSARFARAALDTPQRVAEILDHLFELPAQGGAPAHQHVVATRAQAVGRAAFDDVAQPPPHAVALDRGPDFARYREPDPRRS